MPNGICLVRILNNSSVSSQKLVITKYMLRILFIAIFISPTYWVHSQVPHYLDVFFGDSGKVEIDIDEYDFLSKIQARDSSLYFVGHTGHFDTIIDYDAIIGKVDYWGNLDTSFNGVGYTRFDFPNDNHSVINDFEVGDSGVYFIGSSSIYGVADTLHLFVGKFNFNGALDTTFANQGYFTPNIGSRYMSGNAIKLTPENKIVFCGASENSMSLSDYPIMGRLLPNGSLDTTFGTTGIRIWDSNGELVDSLSNSLQEKHGAGGYLTGIEIVNDNYFFTGYYRPGSNDMCLMIMVHQNGDINYNYAGLGYRVFELSPNYKNTIITNFSKNDTIYSLIDVIGNGYGNVTLYVQDTLGIQIPSNSFNVPNWIVKAKDMARTPNGEIAVSGYAVAELNTDSTDSEGFFVININEQVVYDSSYADAGVFLEEFDSEESGIEDLSYNNGILFGGGYLSKMEPGNVFDFSFVKLIYNPSLTLNEITSSNFTVYPNPVKDALTLEFEKTDSYKLNFLDAKGKVLVNQNIQGKLYVFNVFNFPKGIYFLSVSSLTSGNIQTKKIIIE